jgi:hypothetical protein
MSWCSIFALPASFSSAGFDEHHQQVTCAATIRLRRFNENYAARCAHTFIDLQMTDIVSACGVA